MPLRNTEQLHDDAIGLDARPMSEVAAALAEGQIEAAHSVRNAVDPIHEGATAMAETLKADGKLYYIAAGSSGLMAAADAMELGGTYSIPVNQICILMAGGLPTSAEMPGETEDESAPLTSALDDLSAKDTVIAVSASGGTPYTLEAARIARDAGATVIGIANNADCELFSRSTHAVLLETPPELVSGSTRMGAGTAQKIALNMMSTLMAIELGHVHDGMMVNLRADNSKLRARARGIVGRIANVSDDAAATALAAVDGDVKTAALVAAGASSAEAARQMLDETEGHLRPAIERLELNLNEKLTSKREEYT
ncbi:MAG: N-acetylmuramic acid 6-phosphate etherase [Boseongicola sp.]